MFVKYVYAKWVKTSELLTFSVRIISRARFSNELGPKFRGRDGNDCANGNRKQKIYGGGAKSKNDIEWWLWWKIFGPLSKIMLLTFNNNF
jgi:hypothetical protein